MANIATRITSVRKSQSIFSGRKRGKFIPSAFSNFRARDGVIRLTKILCRVDLLLRVVHYRPHLVERRGQHRRSSIQHKLRSSAIFLLGAVRVNHNEGSVSTNFVSPTTSELLSSQFINLNRMGIFTKLGLPLALALAVGVVWTPTSATCGQIKIEITATVSLVDDPDNLLNNAVAPGDIITGIYTYDSFAVDSNPLPEVGDYRYTTARNGIRLNVNGLRFGTNPANVDFLLEVVNNYQNLDNYVVISYNNLFAVSAMGEFVTNTIDWQLDDPTQTALSSATLPRTPPVLSNWQSIFGLTISSMGDDSFLIRANVTSAVRRR